MRRHVATVLKLRIVNEGETFEHYECAATDSLPLCVRIHHVWIGTPADNCSCYEAKQPLAATRCERQ
jgi:hypothetical protein